MSEEELTLTLYYKDLKLEFKGSPSSVLRSLNEFIAKELPAYDLAKRISMSYSAQDLVNLFSEYIKDTPEGISVWLGNKKLADKQIISLQLIANKLAYELGRIKKFGLTSSEIYELTNLKPKTVSSRLSELTKLGYVIKESDEKGTLYKISTQGIQWVKDAIKKKEERASI
ncbi:MAG: hypothetical protein QXX95_06825 [Nitrososphaerales archaeon]